jgi:SAM-dependent methyltransferase
VSQITDTQAWEDNADFWIEIMRRQLDRFRTELTDQAVLSAIGPAAGHVILDAGCGEGYLSRKLANLGATAIGVDQSAKLIAAAQSMADGGDSSYKVGDITSMGNLDLPPIDVVVANHSVNDLPDPGPAFREFSRVLKPGGRVVILMLHPCFYATRTDREHRSASDDALPAEIYFTPRHLSDHFVVAGLRSPAPGSRYLRPLSEYVDGLEESGFFGLHLIEPHPSPEQWSDRWWRENFRRPLFLLLTAEKRLTENT